MITKQNVYENIENYLKDNKIRYIVQNFPGCDNYELFLGSMSGFIQVETSEDEDDDSVTFQFYSKIDGDGNSLYHSNADTEDEDFSLEDEIDALIDAIKKMNLVVAKIQTKIEQIKEICSENEMNYEDFITIVYNFND